MNPPINLFRSFLISIAFMAAYVVLAPFGMGWLVTTIFIVFLIYTLYRITAGPRAGKAVDPTLPDGEDSEPQEGLVERVRNRKGRKAEGGPDLAREAQERARREADCGLTHDERTAFHGIIKNLDGKN